MASKIFPRPWMTKAISDKGLTKTKFAKLVGTRREYIWAIESGHRTPRPDLAFRMARVLEVDVRDFTPIDSQNEHSKDAIL